MKQVRVRFAPSPTGFLHIGNARIALLNFLFAKKHKGKFILRIEDTDVVRSENRYIDAITNDLHWLGTNWDEGPDTGGERGPYRQSMRTAIYKEYFEKLKRKKLTYPCYCTQDILEKERQELLTAGKAPRYSNKCRTLTSSQRRRYEKEGIQPVWRFKVSGEKIVVRDIVKGDINFDTGLMGDFVIQRQNGLPTFNFAVSIDDMCMEITHIIRGEDHLSNTPRHILLWKAFGKYEPFFAHIPLLLEESGARLSKRHGATSIMELRKLGYLPESLVNYLGQDLEDVPKSASIFDTNKLDGINSQHIRNMELKHLTELIIPYLIDAKLIRHSLSTKKFSQTTKMVMAIKDNLVRLSDSVDYMRIFLDDLIPVEDPEGILAENHVAAMFKTIHRMFVELKGLDNESVKDLFKMAQSELNITGKNFYMPLRMILTGMTKGPELIDIIPLIGKDRILKRLENRLVHKGEALNPKS